MKKLFLVLFCITLWGIANAQDFTEKSVTSDIKEVTVFTEGCQIVRQKSIDLPQGNYLLKFTGLSPFIDPKSIQIKTDGELSVLSVNHQQNYVDKKEKDKEQETIQLKIDELGSKIRTEETNLATLEDELKFLSANIKIGGTTQTVSVPQLREAYAFYNEKTADTRLKILDKNKTIEGLKKEIAKYQNQQSAGTGQKEFPQGEVLVKVENKQTGKFMFELSYLASNAGWLPNYDIIAKSIDDPIRLIYKANIRQDTKEDWKNVRLRLSSANPSNSGMAPKLIPYYLDYNLLPPVYGGALGKLNQVSGRVYDAADGSALSFVSVIIKGTTIGTTTDDNGNFSITLPNQQNVVLEFNFIGYKTESIPVGGRTIINVMMKADATELNDVVVIGYGTSRRDDIYADAASTQSFKAKVAPQPKLSTPIAAEQVQRQTAVDFDIKVPYTIPSDGKNYTVSVDEYTLSADYEYYCAPKADKNVFLKANIINWEKYNLLEGEASVFFENTYIGKTLIDTRTTSDTLNVSLGIDKSVTVARDLQKNFSSKKFMGSKKEETRVWKIAVRNNKSSAIKMMLVDQLPVSRRDDIEVKSQNLSEGVLNAETGEIKWLFSLPSKQTKGIDLQYMVKYPKSEYLLVE